MAGRGVPFAAAAVANAIAWNGNGAAHIAILTPSLVGGFSKSVVARVCGQACGRQGNGPFAIYWESSDDDEASNAMQQFVMANTALGPAVIESLRMLPQNAPIRGALRWVHLQMNALGRVEFARTEIESAIRRQITLRRQFGCTASLRYAAMTVQQAKNREFDGVIVLWPYQVGGDAEHKRRLLYNAVTRAKQWCSIITQGQTIPTTPPFG